MKPNLPQSGAARQSRTQGSAAVSAGPAAALSDAADPPTCCGWCFAHSRAPGNLRGLRRFIRMLQELIPHAPRLARQRLGLRQSFAAFLRGLHDLRAVGFLATPNSARGLAHSKTWRTLGAAVLLACTTWSLAGDRTADHDYDAPAPGSYTLPVIKPAADGALLDPQGKPVSLAELTRGRITVMSFIYTRCAAAKACPYATGVLMQLHRASAEDAALARKLRLVSMSFDPVNDTPERMAAYSMPPAASATSTAPARSTRVSSWRM
jgi:hypothetical protein